VKLRSFCAILILPGLLPAAQAEDALYVVDLRCEDLANPIQIDNPRPGLGWKLQTGSAESRGKLQSAYRIQVASSLEQLQSGNPDLWDSQRVESGNSISVRYDGKALLSRQSCFWKVKVWDEAGNPSQWSAPASWRMALLEATDWDGSEWIGLGKDTRTSAFAEREYMFKPEPEMRRAYASPLLRQEIHLKGPIKARLCLRGGGGLR
jgi:alpha-L-rhamnosidase